MEEMNPTQHYVRLGIMTLLSFLAMYAFMYSMVNSFSNVFMNVNQFYMAGLMAAPMVVFELVLMGMMYPKKTWNRAIIAVSLVALAFFWVGMRKQVAVGDRQFLKSMIPHHAGAILMCQQSSITDPDIKTLCKHIIESQQSEIDQMKRKLSTLP